MKGDWSVYMLLCADNTFYTGVTNNLEKRLIAHNTLPTGAKYTKARRPVKLVYQEDGLAKGEALRRENVVRKLPRVKKLALVNVFTI
jgi:putative endonuclease